MPSLEDFYFLYCPKDSLPLSRPSAKDYPTIEEIKERSTKRLTEIMGKPISDILDRNWIVITISRKTNIRRGVEVNRIVEADIWIKRKMDFEKKRDEESEIA